jgi:hypothetical protein
MLGLLFLCVELTKYTSIGNAFNILYSVVIFARLKAIIIIIIIIIR